MAYLIGGATLHSWGEVPIDFENAEATKPKKTKDGISEMFLKCITKRWLIMDEISAASLYLLGLVEKNTRKGCQGQLYARNAAGDARAWGGLNLLVGGDWLQLPPVAAKSIFRNPFLKDYQSPERRIRDMFWYLDDETIPADPTQLFELTEQVRSNDAWLVAVLTADRVGMESWEMYCFTHGLPTCHVGSWLPPPPMYTAAGQHVVGVCTAAGQGELICGSAACQYLQDVTWPELQRRGCPWAIRQRSECMICQEHRRRRIRVLTCLPVDKQAETLQEFIDAPYVHPYNKPKYHAQICHALQFAKQRERKVYWCVAMDWPLTTDDEDLDDESLHHKREQWLQLHDQHTGGIMGLLPLVQDMPMRLTETDSRQHKLFKHTPAIFKGFELSDSEAARVALVDEPEVTLREQPLALLLQVTDIEGNSIMHRLEPRYVVWRRDKAGHAKVRRRGFVLVPDFAGTAHAYCGSTLEKSKGDLLEWHRLPTREAAQRAYIIRSRVRTMEGCLLVRPYSPALFRLGALPGPNLLLRTQRGQLAERALKQAWREVQAEELESTNTNRDWPWCMLLPCRGCTEKAGGVEQLRPLSAFVYPQTLREAWTTIEQGQDMECTSCRHPDTSICCEGPKCNPGIGKPQPHIRPGTNKPLAHFRQQVVLAWREGGIGPFKCLFCENYNSTGSGRHLKISTTSYFCHGQCRRDWPENAFDETRLPQWLQAGDTACIQCRRCDARDAQHPALLRMHTCQSCKQSLPLSRYAPLLLRYIVPKTTAGLHVTDKCEQCLYPSCSNPTCAEPTKQPVNPPGSHGWRNGRFTCHECRYPPCIGCTSPLL